MLTLAFPLSFCFMTFSCSEEKQPEAAGAWIPAKEPAKTETIEKHLRGFDVAMVETNYRYQELYKAGLESNWENAAYHVEKIRLAISNGLERRPKRTNSAKPFLDEALPEMKAAIDKKDRKQFLQGFSRLTAACNACHAAEDVPFFTVRVPVLSANTKETSQAKP